MNLKYCLLSVLLIISDVLTNCSLLLRTKVSFITRPKSEFFILAHLTSLAVPQTLSFSLSQKASVKELVIKIYY